TPKTPVLPTLASGKSGPDADASGGDVPAHPMALAGAMPTSAALKAANRAVKNKGRMSLRITTKAAVMKASFGTGPKKTQAKGTSAKVKSTTAAAGKGKHKAGKPAKGKKVKAVAK